MVDHSLEHRLRRLVADVLGGREVRVGTIREADKLLVMALPNARKVKGAGPARPRFEAFKGKHPDGVDHKDYLFDQATGRICGHGAGNPHSGNKHVNIKLPDGRKAAIIIDRTS